MASKSAYQSSEPGAEIEEMLDLLDTALDRVKVLYEQYFLGIAKVAPSHLHTDAERKIRELSQHQIRNTALRYRFATLQQKFGAYNTYWRRTLRQIEQGTYFRSLSRVKRQAERTGGDIPEEILAAMPKRMREQVARDRANARAAAARHGKISDDLLPGGANFTLPPLHLPPEEFADIDDVVEISSPLPTELGRQHRVDTAEMQHDNLQQMLADMAAPDVARPPTGAMPRIESTARARDDETQPGVPPPPPPAGRSPGAGPRVPPSPPGARVAPPRIPTAAFPRLPPVPGQGPRAPTPEASRPAAPEAPRDRAVRPSVQAAAIPNLGGAARPGAPRAPTTPGSGPAVPPGPPQRAPTPRAPTAPAARVPQGARPDPLPPGMTEADVRTLYQKYVRARELVGERNDDQTYQALLRTLHNQAPKIMAQYNAKGVEFGVVIKDKQVVLKAKPK